MPKKTTEIKWLKDLKKLDPCGLNFPDNKTLVWGWCQQFQTLKQAWDACKRGDWMLWLWIKHPDQITPKVRRKLVLCACEIERGALKYVPPGEERPRLEIEAAEKWAKNPTEENRAAAYTAHVEAQAAAYRLFHPYHPCRPLRPCRRLYRPSRRQKRVG